MTDVQTNQLSIDRSRPGIWTISISNPPINMLNEDTIDELRGTIAVDRAGGVAKGRRL